VDTGKQNEAVVKRLREMLLRQREKFRLYLLLLEREEISIREGDAEKLRAQAELESSIIAEIHSLRKVISPLEDLHHAAYPGGTGAVPDLQVSLDRLKEQVMARNLRNRALLKERMEDLRLEISGLRSRPRIGAVFAAAAEPRLVDITT
jgi:hypothetical protein